MSSRVYRNLSQKTEKDIQQMINTRSEILFRGHVAPVIPNTEKGALAPLSPFHINDEKQPSDYGVCGGAVSGRLTNSGGVETGTSFILRWAASLSVKLNRSS